MAYPKQDEPAWGGALLVGPVPPHPASQRNNDRGSPAGPPLTLGGPELKAILQHPPETDAPRAPADAPFLLSVIIPVYNEAATIGEVVDRVAAQPISKEIIVVDDGSTDATLDVLATRRHLIQVLHASPENQGKGAAIRVGLTYARGDAVIIQDADLELCPEEYPRLLEPLHAGAEAVYGSRFLDRDNRHLPGRIVLVDRLLTTLMNLLFGARLTDMETAYKLVRRSTLARLKLRARRFEFEPELTAKLLRAGVRIAEVPITYHPRTVDEGKKMGWSDGLHTLFWLLRLRFAPG
jgi:glycosyltransferase involved in cell wall biosynthesis